LDTYYVLYDLEDNLICYFDTITDFLSKYNYKNYEITRKFKNSKSNFINLILENKTYKLYIFC